MELIRAEGRTLFDERLKFATEYMVYHGKTRDQERRASPSIADAHTHLMDYFFISPRIGFWSPQGGCGEKQLRQDQLLPRQRPVHARLRSGAGLLRKIHERRNEWEGYPTVLLDEARRAYSPSNARSWLNISANIPRVQHAQIQDEGRTLTMDMFGPVFLGWAHERKSDPSELFLSATSDCSWSVPCQRNKRKWRSLSFALLKDELEVKMAIAEQDKWTWWAGKVLKSDTMKDNQARILGLIDHASGGGGVNWLYLWYRPPLHR